MKQECKLFVRLKNNLKLLRRRFVIKVAISVQLLLVFIFYSAFCIKETNFEFIFACTWLLIALVNNRHKLFSVLIALSVCFYRAEYFYWGCSCYCRKSTNQHLYEHTGKQKSVYPCIPLYKGVVAGSLRLLIIYLRSAPHC